MPLVMTALLDSMEAVTLESESVYHQLFALQGANSGDQPSLDKVHQKLEVSKCFNVELMVPQYLIDVNHSLLNAIGVGHAQLDLVTVLIVTVKLTLSRSAGKPQNMAYMRNSRALAEEAAPLFSCLKVTTTQPTLAAHGQQNRH